MCVSVRLTKQIRLKEASWWRISLLWRIFFVFEKNVCFAILSSVVVVWAGGKTHRLLRMTVVKIQPVVAGVVANI